MAALAKGLVEHDGSGCGYIERADAASHGNPQQMVAGAADEIVQARAFAAEDEDAVAGEIELVVVARAAFVETDDPEIAALQLFESADEIDDAGNAQVFCSAGAGLDGDRAQRGRPPLGEHDAVDSGSISDTQQGPEILRVFNAIESEQQAAGTRFESFEEIFDRERLLRANQRDDALVGRSLGQLRQLLARLLANAQTGLAAESDKAFKALVVPLAGHKNLVKAAASGLDGFFDRMQTVENFHSR